MRSAETAFLRFSALQRAEIAEIGDDQRNDDDDAANVSVLFNEPKLLKWRTGVREGGNPLPVSVLFNEPKLLKSGEIIGVRASARVFQCSSTSRNC